MCTLIHQVIVSGNPKVECVTLNFLRQSQVDGKNFQHFLQWFLNYCNHFWISFKLTYTLDLDCSFTAIHQAVFLAFREIVCWVSYDGRVHSIFSANGILCI
jgi:hypothetical protein